VDILGSRISLFRDENGKVSSLAAAAAAAVAAAVDSMLLHTTGGCGAHLAQLLLM
jgi:hypothetical protein